MSGKIVFEAIRSHGDGEVVSASIEPAVDQDIEEFDQAFQRLGNEPLSKGERAILKTYLAFKIGVLPAGVVSEGASDAR